MFITWGLYAAAARHEWVQNREEIDEERYRRYFDHFDPIYTIRSLGRAARERG